MITNGVDIIRIERIKKSIKSESFFERVYGEKERAEISGKKNADESLAAAFAAKEAFGKSLGIGLTGFSLNEVQILHDKNGAPYFSLSGNAKIISDNLGAQFSLSISHDGDYAVAFVTCVTKGENSL